MSVKRWGLTTDNDEEDEPDAYMSEYGEGEYVLYADHLSEVGKKVEAARRAAFAEALDYAKARFDPVGYLPTLDSGVFLDWLKARAEGGGE